MARSRKSTKPASLPIGATVLLGLPGVSTPEDWHIGRVLWTDGLEVLVEQTGIAGANRHNQLHSASYVRAIGSRIELHEFKERARKASAELAAKVDECEAALGAARDALWAKLDEIGAAVPALGKPDAAPVGEGQ